MLGLRIISPFFSSAADFEGFGSFNAHVEEPVTVFQTPATPATAFSAPSQVNPQQTSWSSDFGGFEAAAAPSDPLSSLSFGTTSLPAAAVFAPAPSSLAPNSDFDAGFGSFSAPPPLSSVSGSSALQPTAGADFGDFGDFGDFSASTGFPQSDPIVASNQHQQATEQSFAILNDNDR